MGVISTIKNNRFIRGIFFLINSFFGARRGKFKSIGRNVIITPPYSFSYRNLTIGDNVGIGSNCRISSPKAEVTIKGNSVIAEGLTIHSGNHARIVGRFVDSITDADKPSGYDHDVVIENDVWIGSNVTVLAGVTIGRGCTVAAGAVVNRSLPPYCIGAGIPCRVIKFYWDIDRIMEHEAKLYQEKERYTRAELEDIFNQYKNEKV